MRKELYQMLCDRLKEVGGGAIKHIDLWNHNVEFRPIKWNAIVNGVEYRAEPEVALHVVTDWTGSVSDGSPFKEESLEVFDLLEEIHAALACMEGETFKEFDLVESDTNHNHEDIVENIEVYQCVAIKSL